MKDLSVISFNAQRNWSHKSLGDIISLISTECNKSFLCLQEITLEMQKEIEKFAQVKEMFFHSIGENVILIPYAIKNIRLWDIVLPYQSSPLLHIELLLWEKNVHLISGKLTHGIFYARTMLRKQQLKKLLGLSEDQATIIAVDANAPSKREQKIQEKLANRYGFGATKNNITYILERLEPKSIPHRFWRFWGKVFKTRNELDRMFFSGLELINTTVYDYITSSDHIPVQATFSIEEQVT